MGGSSSAPVSYNEAYGGGYPTGYPLNYPMSYPGTYQRDRAIGYPRGHSGSHHRNRASSYPRTTHGTHPISYPKGYLDGFGRRPAVSDQFVGRQIAINGRLYHFQDRLGKGGFGAVYRARGPNGAIVAVKVAALNNMPRPQMAVVAKAFLNEVEQLNRLRKETNHVIVIHDFGFDPRAGNAYIVMELGQENLMKLVERLRAMTQTGGPSIDDEMIREFWHQMVSIIHTLHRNRIVHMDLKPDNLILFGATLKIGDLGIAKKDVALHDAQLGTYGFSAPEVMRDIAGAQRRYDSKADIWSLGAILYFMVYGDVPRYERSNPASPPDRVTPYPDRQLLDMLNRTLVLDPRRRLDIHQVAHHPFSRK